MGSQVLGNLIAAFVLGNLPQFYFVIILTIVSIIAVLTFLSLKKPFTQPRESTRDEDVRYIHGIADSVDTSNMAFTS